MAAAAGATNNNPSSSTSKGKCLLEVKKLQEFEQIAKQCAKPGIFDYGLLRVLTRSYDADDVVVEDFQLVEQKGGNKLQYTMQCMELKDELAITNTLREIHLLQHFGVNKYIMSLYTAFRHRQYVAMVMPAFLPIRNHLDVRYRFKNEGGKAGTGEAKFQELVEIEYWNQFSTTFREENYLKTLGLFDRDAVAFVVKKVSKGLNFIHSKGYVHTELCANNVYIDLRANIKIGGFLHCKKIGSKSRKFTGDMNCLPPECFDEKLTSFAIDTSIDAWSLGLFTLELITGKRHYLKEQKCIRLAKEYLDGVRPLPTLGAMDPKTLKDGKQAYHPAIDGFLARLVTLNPKNRMSYKEVLAHPFIVDKVDRREVLRQWKITSKNFSAMDGSRSLYHDMWAAQGSNPSLNEELLLNIIQAIRHVEHDDFPLFSKVSDSHLCKNYIGIEASVAIPYNDANWSRDVLNMSQRNVYEDEDAKAEAANYHQRDEQLSSDDEWDDTKDRRRRTARAKVDEPQLKSGHPTVDKDYQRFEICFFVKKSWSTKERQIFIAMQFGRWYQRGVIHFTDLIRVVDEVEEVMQNYVLREQRAPDPFNQLPEAVYFASPRREIRFHPEVMADRATRYLQHIYVDVAITKEANETKLKKFAELMEGDPIQLPADLATYQASVCFQDVDPTQFEDLEAQMLGEVKCDAWDVSEDQRQADATNPETYIYKLLIERRRFWFMHRNDYSNEGQASNQARCEKIWGDFRRDYIFRVCKWANLPFKIKKGDAEYLWGNPFANKQEAQQTIRTAEDLPEEQLLEKQLARTKIKQEEDVIDQFKRVEDVEMRQRAVDQHNQDFQGQEGYFKLENQLSRGRGAPTKKFDPLATPAAHGTRKILRKY